jgi:5-methylcytosine-specific restriction enzyme subunit McrC
MVRPTLQIREYQTTTWTLTHDQAHDLTTIPAYVDVRLRPDERYDVHAKANVGTVVLPSLDLLLQPKIDMPDLFFILSYARNVRWSPERFAYAPTQDLFASLIWFFDSEMERARVSGLARDYVEVQDTLATIRGRIDLAEQLRRRQLRPFPLECRFQEYSEDIPLNRVLKEAHAVALMVPHVDAGVATRVGHRYRRFFGQVQSEPFLGLDLPAITFNRMTAHWQPAYWLAELVLSSRSLRDAAGAVLGQAFTVRMDRVFERFIENVVREELAQAGLVLETQVPTALTTGAHVVADNSPLTGVGMRPDLVVTQNGQAIAVADIKYKRTEDLGDFQQPDVYQLFAYCSALALRRGLLIYADGQPHTRQRVALPAYADHIEIDMIGVDLSRPWRTVLQQARDAAHVLQRLAK